MNNAAVGSQITLSAGSGVPAGTYTLLPARYALLPGAFLVTPVSGLPANSLQPDGSTVVPGYLSNAFNGGVSGSTLFSAFDIAPSSVVAGRAEYKTYSANEFLSQQAQAQGAATPRLPVDAGLLAISATATIDLQGTVEGQAGSGGRGSLVEVSGPSSAPVEINATGSGPNAGTFYLNAGQLSSFAAGGLLVGGSSRPTAKARRSPSAPTRSPSMPARCFRRRTSFWSRTTA